MPVKLSAQLVESARSSADLFNRSLTGQIEHWATLGRAIESRLSGDGLAQLLQRVGGTMTISRVAEADQCWHVAELLTEFLAQGPGAQDNLWLQEMSRRGIPIYGTTTAEPGKTIRLEPKPLASAAQFADAVV